MRWQNPELLLAADCAVEPTEVWRSANSHAERGLVRSGPDGLGRAWALLSSRLLSPTLGACPSLVARVRLEPIFDSGELIDRWGEMWCAVCDRVGHARERNT
jgi:hypothetical protein